MGFAYCGASRGPAADLLPGENARRHYVAQRRRRYVRRREERSGNLGKTIAVHAVHAGQRGLVPDCCHRHFRGYPGLDGEGLEDGPRLVTLGNVLEVLEVSVLAAIDGDLPRQMLRLERRDDTATGAVVHVEERADLVVGLGEA